MNPELPQDRPLKLLFVCSRNQIRSLTAEKIFSNMPGVQVRSAGTQPNARVVVTPGQVGWADIIFVMERSHLNRMRQKLGDALEGKQVVVLRIPDEYRFMQEELVEELRKKVGEYVCLQQESEEES
jgi:predicted protein tyrosine phosphatase